MFKRLVQAVTLAAAIATASLAVAQEYPTKPIRILVAYTAGVTPDVVSRMLATSMGAILGQSIIVDNKPGAGAKANPKG